MSEIGYTTRHSDWHPLSVTGGFFIAAQPNVNRRNAPVFWFLLQTVRRSVAAGANPPEDRRIARSGAAAE